MQKKGTGGFLHPEKILEQLDIQDNIQAADFGCGRGYFSIPLAKIILNGKVYAFDVVEEALEAVRGKAKLENINNIETIRANLEITGGSKLDDDSMDLVILANILYQSKKKKEILKEAKRVLKSGGRIALIEWLIGASLAPKGDSGWEMLPKEKAQKMAEAEGLDLDSELDIEEGQHYGLVFRK